MTTASPKVGRPTLLTIAACIAAASLLAACLALSALGARAPEAAAVATRTSMAR